MFRKKQTPPPSTRRTVQRQPAASVFSYYASRQPSESMSGRRREDSTVGSSTNPVRRIRPRAAWLQYVPSFLAGVVLVGCLIYVSTLTTSPKLRVVSSQSDRALVGNTTAYQAEARKIFERSPLNRSKLLINTDKIADDLQSTFPELGDVSIILPLVSRRPVIEVRPTRPSLILSTLDGVFVIDAEGRTVADANEAESSLKDRLPVVQDESGLPLEQSKYALPKETVAFITEINGQLAAKQIAAQAFILPPLANELHVRLAGRPYFVKFDTKGEGRHQAGTLIAVKERLEQEKKTPAEYIDVRVPEKAFYK